MSFRQVVIGNTEMDFIELVNTEKDRDCESKKKVSFAQKSPIDTRKSKVSKTFDSLGHSFSIEVNEVIESALFDRIKRDCSGELIGVTSVRRFRKVGSDEWFSVEAAGGNNSWNTDFTPSNDEEAIIQGQENSGKGQEEEVTKDYATSFAIVNPFENAKKEEAKKKNLRGLLIVSAVLTAGFFGYKLIKKK